MMTPPPQKRGHYKFWDETFQQHPFYRSRTVMDVWSELCTSATTGQQTRAAVDDKVDRAQTFHNPARMLAAEWWPYGGPDWPNDDPRELAFRRVVAGVRRDQAMTQQEASRSQSRLTILIAAAVLVGLARGYMFWRWETFSPDVQDALRIGWFILFPLLLLPIGIIAIAMPRISKCRYLSKSARGSVTGTLPQLD